MLHRFGRGSGGDDLAAIQAGIAVTVIAIVVRVDQRRDLGRGDAREAIQHRAGMGRVEHGVDQQRFAGIAHQSRIGKAPTAVGLKVSEGAGAERDDAGLIAGLAET